MPFLPKPFIGFEIEKCFVEAVKQKEVAISRFWLQRSKIKICQHLFQKFMYYIVQVLALFIENHDHDIHMYSPFEKDMHSSILLKLHIYLKYLKVSDTPPTTVFLNVQKFVSNTCFFDKLYQISMNLQVFPNTYTMFVQFKCIPFRSNKFSLAPVSVLLYNG